MKKQCSFEGLESSVRFIIWDLAGQSQFKRVRQSYLANAEAGILVYDVTKEQSFDNISNWFNEIIDISLMVKCNFKSFWKSSKIRKYF